MSAHAASLKCPICFHSGVFDSAETLRNRLIFVSTNKILCPVCQDEVIGLDKLTIHLFSHVKIMVTETCTNKNNSDDVNPKSIQEKSSLKTNPSVRKKSKASVSKNKTPPAVASEPVKFVKIYPKLPVVSLNKVSTIDISQVPIKENVTNKVFVSTIETEAPQSQTKLNTICNICGLQFVDCNILKMHRCLIHNIEENSAQNFTRYNCHLCTKNFKMRGSLMVHLRMAHYGFSAGNCSASSNNTLNIADEESNSNDKPLLKNDTKQWQCDVCRKCFTTKYFLKKHKRLHTGETPYSCAQCNKTFTFQQSYHKHLLYHNDEKPHTCAYCGRAFKEISTLHNHQRIHTGEKPFSCETCGKCFRQRVSYLVHRRIHTGVMPYKCTACEKSFRYKVSQRTHKCRAQPPGTVIRQSGDLLEKLKFKHSNSDIKSLEEQHQHKIETSAVFMEVSEANAELVRSSAKLSFEDTETENFSLISDQFETEIKNSKDCAKENTEEEQIIENNESLNELLNSNFEELIDSIPLEEKNMPSPSDILKNLCLSQEDDSSDLKQQENGLENHEIFEEFM